MDSAKFNALAADIEDVLLRWHGDSDDAETLRRVADDLLMAGLKADPEFIREPAPLYLEKLEGGVWEPVGSDFMDDDWQPVYDAINELPDNLPWHVKSCMGEVVLRSDDNGEAGEVSH